MRNLIVTHAVVAFLAVGITCPPGAQATDMSPEQTAVMATINRFVAAFNKGDAKAATAECVDDMSIIDEFPPYEWHGPGTLLKWMEDYGTDATKNAITEGGVTIAKPKHVEVIADRAYVVVPANYAYKRAGKQVNQNGSMMALTLHKIDAGWRITGWSWARK
ncbi:MAG: nuclear transport factor 2 family protein [Candidatus Eiseniibacteriota bacterium]